jgi:hypothetical protein
MSMNLLTTRTCSTPRTGSRNDGMKIKGELQMAFELDDPFTTDGQEVP